MSTASTSDESPLLFHATSLQNMRVSPDGTIARRLNTTFFTRGLVFGTRPVKIAEKVTFKLMEVAENLGGFVYVGFTSRDPDNQVQVSCKKLAKESGFWTWFFPKDLCTQSRSLFFSVTREGEVRYGVDGTEKGKFQGYVLPSQQLWPLFDIFGNSSAIRLVQAPPTGEKRSARKTVPMMVHPAYSRNVRVIKNVSQRVDKGYTQGYIFSSRPITPNETLLIQISPNQPSTRFVGVLHLGVTSCDPAHLSPDALPDNVNHLVDRPEYWVLICDFSKLDCCDEIGVTLTNGGQISFHLNGGKFKGVVHVDSTLKLWLFVNVYGTTQPIHLLACPEQLKDEEKECVVCYDNAIEAALYRCGHTCMCFECAVEQWQGKGDGHCPLCRAVIKDVIRINK